ncbi:hypothetical protein [Piscinibacter koreensis]|uniref:Uncharacterized protein n=1 Tax=Piscinibacter koreensis TaxID=2742824 RepID=A0A7Y6TYD1_9BURK|nr:hypothetical protein [Schlegelella koreensis]NUZ07971.1 hypothetical protein [Schlegelella koreensis]
MSPLYVLVPLAALAAVALGRAIGVLVRRARLDVAARLPVVPEQFVALPAGSLVLHLDGRQGSTRFAGLSFALADAADTPVQAIPLVFRSRRTSLRGRVLLAVVRFEVPVAGRYRCGWQAWTLRAMSATAGSCLRSHGMAVWSSRSSPSSLRRW